ncbi:hypothetical protein K1719_018478 [Acacia pycnantha]|nr:hypothetical protein K1719_018478 [Acacia pycnantha]
MPKIVKVESLNSMKECMGVVLEVLDSSFKAHCKHAAEIPLTDSGKVIDSCGNVVPLDEESINELKNTLEEFASEAMRPICLAYMEIGREHSVESAIHSGRRRRRMTGNCMI